MRRAVIMTPWFCGGPMPFALVRTDSGFTIKPVRPSMPGFILMSLFLIAFGSFLLWLAVKSRDRTMIIGMSIPVTLGVVGGIGGHVWEYLWQKSRGPVLHYNSAQKTFSFPRANLVLRTDQIEAFAIVTGRKESKDDGDITQLQVYAADGKTHHLISCHKSRDLQPFIGAIQKETRAAVIWRSNAVDEDELDPGQKV